MARKMIDIGLDENEDLEFKDGDFVAEESTYQHQRQLLLNNKGEFKQNPDICVGLDNYIDDEGAKNIIGAIVDEFTKDGMDVKDTTPNFDSISNSKVKVFPKANYL